MEGVMGRLSKKLISIIIATTISLGLTFQVLPASEAKADTKIISN